MTLATRLLSPLATARAYLAGWIEFVLLICVILPLSALDQVLRLMRDVEQDEDRAEW